MHKVTLEFDKNSLDEIYNVPSEVVRKIDNTIKDLEIKLKSGILLNTKEVLISVYNSITPCSANVLLYASFRIGHFCRYLDENFTSITIPNNLN